MMVDDPGKYPLISQDSLLVPTGMTSYVSIVATSVTSDDAIRGVDSNDRNCFFSDEYHLKLHVNYTRYPLAYYEERNGLHTCSQNHLVLASGKLVLQNKQSRWLHCSLMKTTCAVNMKYFPNMRNTPSYIQKWFSS